MAVKTYNKLVRDKIPSIIAASGKKAVCRVLSDAEYIRALDDKLLEEVKEYLDGGDIEELADIAEVLDAIRAARGCADADFMGIKQKKFADRGGFSGRILLTEVNDGS